METFAIILFLFSGVLFISAFVALIKPSLFKETSRWKAFGQQFLAFFVFFVASVILMPKTETNDTTLQAENSAEIQSESENESIEAEAPVETGNEQAVTESVEDTNPEAHGYTVVSARDFSIPAKQRKGGIWYVASDAQSAQDRAYTLIQATKDLFGEMAEPSHATVWLYPSEEAAENGLANIGTAVYVPDGEGKDSGFPEDEVWDVEVSDYQYSDLQKQIQGLWIANRANYLDSEGLLNEDGLRAQISSELGISDEELGGELLPLYILDLEKFDYNPDKDEYTVLAGKSEDSVANPEDFTADMCREELSCWAEEHLMAATFQCEKMVEQFAQYDFEWTDGFLGTKLTHYKWAGIDGKEQGIVTYLGNEIKFQNGFGAWTPIIYECDYDPNTDTLLDVRVSEGRM